MGKITAYLSFILSYYLGIFTIKCKKNGSSGRNHHYSTEFCYKHEIIKGEEL